MNRSDPEVRRFDAHFTTTDAGWIDLTWSLVPETDEHRDLTRRFHPNASTGLDSPEVWSGRHWLSAVYSPFGGMLVFLQLVAFREDECEWEIGGEGREQLMAWNDGRLLVDSSGITHEAQVDRVQFVESLYGAFREFAISNRYRPEEWEQHWRGEALRNLRKPSLDRFIRSKPTDPVAGE